MSSRSSWFTEVHRPSSVVHSFHSIPWTTGDHRHHRHPLPQCNNVDEQTNWKKIIPLVCPSEVHALPLTPAGIRFHRATKLTDRQIAKKVYHSSVVASPVASITADTTGTGIRFALDNMQPHLTSAYIFNYIPMHPHRSHRPWRMAAASSGLQLLPFPSGHLSMQQK